MALVLKDRVKETSITTGTGNFTLSGAVAGFQSFSVIGNSNTVYYAIVRNGYDEWEIGIGTYTLSGTTLSRNTVLESSNSGSKVNFSAGTKEVFCTYPAEKSVTIDDVQTLSNKTLASPSVTGSITFSDSSTQATAATGFGFKNRIINGAMMIDQRNAGATMSPVGTSAYTVDRWQAVLSQSGKFNAQQNQGSVTPPVGFSNYLGLTVASAATIGASDYFSIIQKIEGFNTADLSWGTANAQPVTLSFRVYSSLTGSFSGAIENSANNRSYPFSYTVSSANTWTTVSVTIPGDTTGTWVGVTNGVGMGIWFDLGCGSSFRGTVNTWAGAQYIGVTGTVQVAANAGAKFYITGVQLEKGSTATSFDYRPYGTELALCQRYLPCFNSTGTTSIFGVSVCPAATTGRGIYTFKVTPRVPPTGIIVSSASHFVAALGSTGFVPSAIIFAFSSSDICSIDATISGATVGQSGQFYASSASGQIQFTGCEL